MATQNDFLPFAVDPGANVLSQASYEALSAVSQGYQSGTAQSAACNKTWRQGSLIASVIAQFIVAQTNQPAIDDGTTATLLQNFTAAVNAAAKNSSSLVDTGAVNAYAAANPVPMTALPTASGVIQALSIAHTNTGASTYAPDELPAEPIFGIGGAALQGGELVAGGIATLVSYVGPLLNSGGPCWVLVSCTGGAVQVPNATQSGHAVNLGQLQSGTGLTSPAPTDSSTRMATTAWVYAAMQFIANAAGFSLTANYVKFPSWLGGLIFQWGQISVGTADTPLVFPLAFTNGVNYVCAFPNYTGNGVFAVYNSLSLTGVSFGTWATNSTRAAAFCYWLAIGK
ncbi:gp53-like domain-containing protein [Burkholderia gladioli]|uniref:gp53-like domain-containing protein n=1 Tax=Burkholderia gladioli TaxID=28095 RepID=UPI001641818C|nr:hypothetical protein [Burkholderia gladioli]